jgi:drug/metabolite transporter (DMT)-like permease
VLTAWVQLSLFAAVANTAKVYLVKTRCRNVHSTLLVFYSRLLPALVLPILIPFISFSILEPVTFFAVTLTTSLLTIVASILYFQSLQTGHISRVVPIQASVPMFMMICTYLLYGEIPSRQSFFFIVLLILSIGYMMAESSRRRVLTDSGNMLRPVVKSFFAAALFGVSTVLDRVAIASAINGALIYSAVWNVVTAVILFVILKSTKQSLSLDGHYVKPVLALATVTLAAFVLQQSAVQASLHQPNGVTFVKSLVMLHITLAALLGVWRFRERWTLGLLLSSLIAFASGIGMLLSR